MIVISNWVCYFVTEMYYELTLLPVNGFIKENKPAVILSNLPPVCYQLPRRAQPRQMVLRLPTWAALGTLGTLGRAPSTAHSDPIPTPIWADVQFDE